MSRDNASLVNDPPPVRTSPVRVMSLDIFRGLTMAVMIFVNDLASVKGLPWWTYHMPGAINGMTYVDVVFPAFLFILGMSLPLATAARLKRDASPRRLWWHVILRAISLVVLGVILANASSTSAALIGINPGLWAFLALLGAVLFWLAYPLHSKHRTLFLVLKYAGLVLLLAMLAIFRRVTHDGSVAWLSTSYWEILGIIGWTYLAASILYIPTRRWQWAPAIWCGLLLLLNVLTSANFLSWPDHAPFYLWPFNSGAFALLTMAGIFVSDCFLRDGHVQPFTRSASKALLFAAVTALLGWLLLPLGLSKIRATPSWCLFCIAISATLFTAVNWICDQKGWLRWSALFSPAGSNTLLTYLLPDLYYFGLLATSLALPPMSGVAGVLKSLVFTAAILLLSAMLTQRKIRMQL